MNRICIITLGTLFLSAMAPANVFAHAVGVDCKLVGGTVQVEVYYDDDSPGVKAKVQVRNADDEVIADGVTDKEGKWSFAAPSPGIYMVHVDAGAGHRARKRSTVPEPKSAAETTPTPDRTDDPSKADTISDGASRAEFTRTPWTKIAIGLTVIGGCSGAFVLAMRLKKRTGNG